MKMKQIGLGAHPKILGTSATDYLSNSIHQISLQLVPTGQKYDVVNVVYRVARTTEQMLLCGDIILQHLITSF